MSVRSIRMSTGCTPRTRGWCLQRGVCLGSPSKKCWRWRAWAQSVLHPRSVEFAGKYGVPVRVLSSFEEGPGTSITLEEDGSMEQPLVSGIAFTRDEAKISVRAVPDVPGVARRSLVPVSWHRGRHDRANLRTTEARTSLTFTVKRSDYDRALAVVQEGRRRSGCRPWWWAIPGSLRSPLWGALLPAWPMKCCCAGEGKYQHPND